MRIFFAHIDWNDKMKNKTATESWNILKSELNSVINRCSYEKARETVHEETSVKICFQKDIWRVYKHNLWERIKLVVGLRTSSRLY